jgi:hypothetical protein
MTTHVTTTPDAEAESRWRNWQARGIALDQRRATTMRRLMVLITVMLAVWIALAARGLG